MKKKRTKKTKSYIKNKCTNEFILGFPIKKQFFMIKKTIMKKMMMTKYINKSSNNRRNKQINLHSVKLKKIRNCNIKIESINFNIYSSITFNHLN